MKTSVVRDNRGKRSVIQGMHRLFKDQNELLSQLCYNKNSKSVSCRACYAKRAKLDNQLLVDLGLFCCFRNYRGQITAVKQTRVNLESQI